MKKIFLAFLIIATSFTMVSCGNSKTSGKDSDENQVKQEESKEDKDKDKTDEEDKDKGEEKDKDEEQNQDSGKVSSGDWKNLEFEIEGEKYKIGMPVTKVIDNGWVLEKDEKLKSNRVTSMTYFKKGDLKISFGILNDTDKEISLSEGKIASVSFLDFHKYKNSLAGGVKIGTSKDDIIKAYGKPTTEKVTSEEQKLETLTYEDGSKKMRIDLQEGKLKQVVLQDY